MTTLLHPDHPRAPKYWRDDPNALLGPAMGRYLRGKAEEYDDINLIRAYLRQWIDSPVWDGGTKLDELRRQARGIRTRKDIDRWILAALDLAIDPL